MLPVYLNQFLIIKPKNVASQEQLIDWIIKCHQTAESASSKTEKLSSDLIDKLFRRYGVKPAQISQRYCESDDINSLDFTQNRIYKIDENHCNGVDINERALFFSEKAYEVMNKFYDLNSEINRPDHIVHVSCTGYISPSAPQRIVSEEKWKKRTGISHAYHMGCYASLPAIRLARGLVVSENLDPNAHYTADIIHNELCGLHMNALAQTPEQMVVQTLFADGHVKYTATTKLKEEGMNLKVLAILEKVIPNSQEDMSWIPASWGMQMNLSREVPMKIKPELKIFTDELFKKAGLTIDTGLKSIFAIHPGGPKIIDSVAEALELKEEQISESRKVLFERGNMSSATLPHVWNEILLNQYPVGTKIISFAFGPGLTIFGSLFEVC